VKNAPRLLLTAGIVLGSVGLDQWSKHLARVHLRGVGTVRLAGDLLVLRYAENQGAFLSLGAGWHPVMRAAVFGALSLLIVAGAAVYLLRDRGLGPTRTGAMALVVGGGAGNLIDRLARGGSVTDFMNLGIGRLRTGIFNLADRFLLAVMGVFVLTAEKRLTGRPTRGAGADQTPGT